MMIIQVSKELKTDNTIATALIISKVLCHLWISAGVVWVIEKKKTKSYSQRQMETAWLQILIVNTIKHL